MDNPEPGGTPRPCHTRYSVMLKTLTFLGAQVQPCLPFLMLGGIMYVSLVKGFTTVANSLDNSSHTLARSVDLGRPGGFKAGLDVSKFQFWWVKTSSSLCRLHWITFFSTFSLC